MWPLQVLPLPRLPFIICRIEIIVLHLILSARLFIC